MQTRPKTHTLGGPISKRSQHLIKLNIFFSLIIITLLVGVLPYPNAQAAGAPPYPYHLPLVFDQAAPPFAAHNVIVLIGDGMGLEQVKAGGIYLHGHSGTLPFEAFPYQGQMTTYSASSNVTDSAAAATAMATGHKVKNGVISQAIPGSGVDLYTLLEYASEYEMSTGLVTTTPITNATPASFGAHVPSRSRGTDIAYDYMNGSHPNVLMGGGGSGIYAAMAQASGYTVVTDQAQLLALDSEQQRYTAGLFGNTYLPYESDGMSCLPHLSEMAAVALNILDNDPDGFFVMIEGGRIDTAAHKNNITRMIGEIVEFANTAQVAISYAQSHPDTIIVVLADHETGGLRVLENNGQGILPGVSWSTTGHTPVNVGVWISGPLEHQLPAVIDNTQIPDILTNGRFYP